MSHQKTTYISPEQALAEARAMLKNADDENVGLSTEQLTRYELLMSIVEASNTRQPLQVGIRGVANGPDTRVALPSMREYRALSEGTGSAGGNLVPVQLGPGIVNALEAKSVVLGMPGAQIVEMDSETMNVPYVDSSHTVYQVNELSATTLSDASFGVATLTAYKFGVGTSVSRELLDDSKYDLRQYLADQLMRDLALKIDAALLSGSGSSAPQGILTASAFGATSLGTDGGVITLTDVKDAKYAVEAANGNPSIFLAHPRTINTLTSEADSNARFQLEPDASKEASGFMFGLRPIASTQISVADVQGNSSAASKAAVIDPSGFIIGRRLPPELVYDPYTLADQFAVRIFLFARYAGIAIVRAGAVRRITGIIAS